jgi:hypothetical protein
MVVLDQFLTDRNGGGRALIKIDVEGAELEVIEGGTAWLTPTNFFLIEVHNLEGLVALKKEFLEVGLRLLQVDQKPLPLLGRETRGVNNWWLVSDLTLNYGLGVKPGNQPQNGIL